MSSKDKLPPPKWYPQFTWIKTVLGILTLLVLVLIGLSGWAEGHALPTYQPNLPTKVYADTIRYYWTYPNPVSGLFPESDPNQSQFTSLDWQDSSLHIANQPGAILLRGIQKLKDRPSWRLAILKLVDQSYKGSWEVIFQYRDKARYCTGLVRPNQYAGVQVGPGATWFAGLTSDGKILPVANIAPPDLVPRSEFHELYPDTLQF